MMHFTSKVTKRGLVSPLKVKCVHYLLTKKMYFQLYPLLSETSLLTAEPTKA